jgi:hypothetical protein
LSDVVNENGLTVALTVWVTGLVLVRLLLGFRIHA